MFQKIHPQEVTWVQGNGPQAVKMVTLAPEPDSLSSSFQLSAPVALSDNEKFTI